MEWPHIVEVVVIGAALLATTYLLVSELIVHTELLVDGDARTLGALQPAGISLGCVTALLTACTRLDHFVKKEARRSRSDEVRRPRRARRRRGR